MSRRLIVLCDGTWGTKIREPDAGGNLSNVGIFSDLILDKDAAGNDQILKYDTGVGTNSGLRDKLFGGMFGSGLADNVKEAYTFLVNHYVPGDEIYFFGFSRGAFTVRSTAGLVRKCGIAKNDDPALIDRAYEIYRHRDKGDPTAPDTNEAKEFRGAHAVWPMVIRFIGVWDTVGRLGIPAPRYLQWLGPFSPAKYEFRDTDLSRSVEFAYHAIAVDERLRVFEPTLWSQHPEAEHQTMEQAWFPGVHSDVGGGYTSAGLSNGALHWLAEKARATGLALDGDALAKFPTDPLGLLHDKRSFPMSLLPQHTRKIGAADRGNESLHSTTFDRRRDLRTYRPKNLEDYLDRPLTTPP
jgi:uncharacterized protein (DUF2235 family)